jgi:indolepyruvate ferredoxin oxidoreductase alpha subunit
MTGGQDNPGTGFKAQGEVTEMVDIEALVKACGIKHVIKVNPNDRTSVKNAFNYCFDLDEPSVIITDWPCVLKRKYREEDIASYPEAFQRKFEVITDKCIGCKACLRTGCPPLIFDAENKKTSIDRELCVGCGVCADVCPVDAIQLEVK